MSEEPIFPGVIIDDHLVQKGLKDARAAGLIEPRLRCGMPEFAVEGLSMWAGRPVKYFYALTLVGLSPEQIEQAYVDACDEWNKVCGVMLAKTGASNTSNIDAKSGKIDGASGTLAYSYLPGTPSSMKTRLSQLFETTERWTYAWAKEVICHEVGHAIGLSHSPDKMALMYPYSHSGAIPKPQSWDINEAVKRYGSPPTIPSVTTQPPISTTLPPFGISTTPPPVPADGNGILLVDGKSYHINLTPISD